MNAPRSRKVDPLNQLRQRKYEAGHGDAEAFNRQHAKGKLTARERIARLVDRSTRAVEKHLTSVYHKLGVQQHKDKRREAVRIARQKHLLPPDTTAGIT